MEKGDQDYMRRLLARCFPRWFRKISGSLLRPAEIKSVEDGWLTVTVSPLPLFGYRFLSRCFSFFTSSFLPHWALSANQHWRARLAEHTFKVSTRYTFFMIKPVSKSWKLMEHHGCVFIRATDRHSFKGTMESNPLSQQSHLLLCQAVFWHPWSMGRCSLIPGSLGAGVIRKAGVLLACRHNF